MAEINPQPLPPGGERVRVYVTSDVTYNLEKMQKITADILGRLGCGNCHSGRILDFVHLDEFIVDAKLNVHAIAPGQGIG